MVFRPFFLLTVLASCALAQDTSRAAIGLPDTAVIQSTVVLPNNVFSPRDSAFAQAMRPRFVWPAARETALYTIQVATDSAFLLLVYEAPVVNDTTMRAGIDLLNDSLYFWRVGWSETDGEMTWSAVRRFAVGSAPSFSDVAGVFDPTRRGGTSQRYAFLSNPVVDTISVDSVLFFSWAFRIAGFAPALVLPTDSLRFTLMFQPEAFGIYKDTMVVFTSQGVTYLPVRAESPAPILSVQAEGIGLGPSNIADTVAAILTIRNMGSVNDLSLEGFSTRTPLFAASYGSTSAVRAGDSAKVLVRFHVQSFLPNVFGRYVDTLTLGSDGGTAKVVLSGETPPPRIQVVPEVLDVGLVGAQDSAVGYVRLTNGSVNTLRVDSINTRGSSFKAGIKRASISRGDTLSLPVVFRPQRPGSHVDSLLLFNNSWTPRVSVPLLGSSPFPLLQADYERIAFELTEVGDSVSVRIRLWNSSLTRLKIDSVKVRSRQFRLTRASLPRVLRVGEDMNVEVVFFPDGEKTFHDTLIVFNNSRDTRWKIPLRGEGIPTQLGRMSVGRSNVYEFYPNFPNPFSTSTTFSYNLPVRSRVRLEVYATLGQNVALVVDAEQDAGVQNVVWETTLTSGVYYCRFFARAVDDPLRQFQGTSKIMVLR